jgi:hypothetical protein
MGMRILMVLVIAIAMVSVSDVHGQRSKKKTKKKGQTLQIRVKKPEPLPSLITVDVPVRQTLSIPNAAVSQRDVETTPPPEPLIGVKYFVDYPTSALERNIEGNVRFFATVKGGVVTNVVLQGDADPVLLDAVRDAASKLHFDASWHTPDKQEFVYTREVLFRLPYDITARP